MSRNAGAGDPFVGRIPFLTFDSGGLAWSIKRYIQSAVRRWQKRKTVRALEKLNDWILEDIGVSRHEIPRLVEELFAVDTGLNLQARLDACDVNLVQSRRGAVPAGRIQASRGRGRAPCLENEREMQPLEQLAPHETAMIGSAPDTEINWAAREPNPECLARWEDDGGRVCDRSNADRPWTTRHFSAARQANRANKATVM